MMIIPWHTSNTSIEMRKLLKPVILALLLATFPLLIHAQQSPKEEDWTLFRENLIAGQQLQTNLHAQPLCSWHLQRRNDMWRFTKQKMHQRIRLMKAFLGKTEERVVVNGGQLSLEEKPFIITTGKESPESRKTGNFGRDISAVRDAKREVIREIDQRSEVEPNDPNKYTVTLRQLMTERFRVTQW